MLNHDEEEVLKVLLKLYREQNIRNISGSFKNFPAKYQICYKEIISRLNDKNLIEKFTEFIAGDFVLTIMPSALEYFSNKEKLENNEIEPLIKDETSIKAKELEPISKSNLDNISDTNLSYKENSKQINEIKEKKTSCDCDNITIPFYKNANELQKNNPEEYSIVINIIIGLKSLEKKAELLGGEQKNELKTIINDIKNIFENIKTSSYIIPNNKLIEKIYINAKSFPWFYEEIINILGNIFMKALIE